MTTLTNPTDEHRAEIDSIHTSVAVAGAILAVASWSGLLWLVTNRLPTVPNRWAFYALLHIALTGTALPVLRLLHRRFSRQQGLYVRSGVLMRQALWFGLFGTLCVWLRIPRLLSIAVAALIAGGILTIEALLRLRERTQWRPD